MQSEFRKQEILFANGNMIKYGYSKNFIKIDIFSYPYLISSILALLLNWPYIKLGHKSKLPRQIA